MWYLEMARTCSKTGTKSFNDSKDGLLLGTLEVGIGGEGMSRVCGCSIDLSSFSNTHLGIVSDSAIWW